MVSCGVVCCTLAGRSAVRVGGGPVVGADFVGGAKLVNGVKFVGGARALATSKSTDDVQSAGCAHLNDRTQPTAAGYSVVGVGGPQPAGAFHLASSAKPIDGS